MIILWILLAIVALGLLIVCLESICFPNHSYIPELGGWVRKDGDPDRLSDTDHPLYGTPARPAL